MLGTDSPPGSGWRQIFIGRANEIALLRAALDDATSGRGRLVLLSGPPGIGKSRLTAEFAELVGSEDVRVMIGRSWEAGGAPVYWPWVQAIRSYLRSADPQSVSRQTRLCLNELATLLPELVVKDNDPTPLAGARPTDRFLLFEAVMTFLRNVAEDLPLLVVLEDLQAADVPSLLLLRFVSDQLGSSRILVLATYRDVELTADDSMAPTLSELHRAPSTIPLALKGLNVAEVSRFVEAASGMSTPAPVVQSLYRHTNGNPLFLGEALRLLKTNSGGQVTTSLTRAVVPAEIRVLIERRLAGLDPALRRLLEVASVFGNEFDAEALRRYEDAGTEEILDRLGDAVSAGLLLDVGGVRARFRFSHDLIRHTLYAGLTPGTRATAHRRAAESLESLYGAELEDHLAEVSMHYFAAASSGDPDRAIEFGRRAGDQALDSMAYEEAVRLYAMVAEVMEGDAGVAPAELGDLYLALGDARVRAGDLPGAGEAFLRAAEIARRLPDARRLARAAVGYGGRFVWARAGHDQRMVPLLQDALVLLGGEDDRLRVRLMSRLACALRSSADREYCDALSGQALELARRLGDPATLIFALTGRAGAIWWPENPEERLEIGTELIAVGRESRSIEGVVDGHMTRCAAYAEMGEMVAARRELETLSRTGGPLRLAAYHWLEGAMKAWFALFAGSLGEVEPWVQEMRGQPPTTPARDNVSAALFQLFLLRREQGVLGELEATLRVATTDFSWYPLHRIALAHVLTTGDRRSEAHSILSALSAGQFSGLHRDNYWVPSLCLASEVAVELEDLAVARILYELLKPYARRNAVAFAEGPLGSVSRYLGLLAELSGDLEAADRHLADAETANRRMGARPWLAHTLFERARVRRLLQDSTAEEPKRWLEECRRLCDEIGLTSLSRQLEMNYPAGAIEQPPAPSIHSAELRREGEYFTVAFDGGVFQVKDMKGLRYLAYLLSAPGREIHVLDLVAGLSGGDPAAGETGHADIELAPAGDDAGPVLDRRARQAYTARLRELEEDIAEAEAFGDDSRAASVRDERDFLVSELAAGIGLGGRNRVAVSQSERARVNVTRAIRAASNKLGVHSPALGDHLAMTIHTGTFCVYRPDPRIPIIWRT
ncbi:MAG TPA: AAA family ATPase [Acidimicrobiia bacterium]|nr:AAA family ATPase [Acidimicrobiia bacterium]